MLQQIKIEISIAMDTQDKKIAPILPSHWFLQNEIFNGMCV